MLSDKNTVKISELQEKFSSDHLKKSVAYLYAGMFYVNEKKEQIIRIDLNYLFVKQNKLLLRNKQVEIIIIFAP